MKTQGFKSVISVSLPVGVIQEIDEITVKQNKSRAEFIRDIVIEYMTSEHPKKQKRSF